MRLEGRRRTATILALSFGAATLQVLVAAPLSGSALVLVLIAVVSAVLAAIGSVTPTRRLFEYPIGAAILSGTLVVLVSLFPAAIDRFLWIPLWVQVDIVIMWIVVWVLRSRDIEVRESAWNRRFIADQHRPKTSYTERSMTLGERTEERLSSQRELADPFATPDEARPSLSTSARSSRPRTPRWRPRWRRR